MVLGDKIVTYETNSKIMSLLEFLCISNKKSKALVPSFNN